MKKIGILTFHNAINYGAILQAYSLQEKLISLGYDCEIIDYHNEYFKEIYDSNLNPFKIHNKIGKYRLFLKYIIKFREMFNLKKKYKKLRTFMKENYKISRYYDVDNIDKANLVYDFFVVGSDQVWNMDLSKYDLNYYLNFVDKDEKKISYAASLGKEYLTGFEYYNIKKLVSKFKDVSIREASGFNLLKEYCDIESKVVLDPTLLNGSKFWDKVALKSGLNIKSKYVLIYMVQESKQVIEAAKIYAKKNNLKIISINRLKDKFKYTCKDACSVPDFIYLIKNASCIFTSSFHGLVFSINFNKEFYYGLSNKIPNNNSRLTDICINLGLKDREINENTNYNRIIDYEVVNEKLSKMISESINYIIKSLGDQV